MPETASRGKIGSKSKAIRRMSAQTPLDLLHYEPELLPLHALDAPGVKLMLAERGFLSKANSTKIGVDKFFLATNI